jgi:hypothetical protein
MPEHSPLLTTRIRRQDDGYDESTLARQWRLLKLLIFAPKGFTVKELVALSGVSEKTVRRTSQSRLFFGLSFFHGSVMARFPSYSFFAC